MARRRDEYRLMAPTRFNCIDRSLRGYEAGAILIRVFRKPVFQRPDNFGRMDDGISTLYDVPHPCIIQISFNHHFEPAQANLFPRYRIARLGDDGEIAAHALLQHESATASLSRIKLSRPRSSVRGHSPAPKPTNSEPFNGTPA